jgi:hypothetical protein
MQLYLHMLHPHLHYVAALLHVPPFRGMAVELAAVLLLLPLLLLLRVTTLAARLVAFWAT